MFKTFINIISKPFQSEMWSIWFVTAWIPQSILAMNFPREPMNSSNLSTCGRFQTAQYNHCLRLRLMNIIKGCLWEVRNQLKWKYAISSSYGTNRWLIWNEFPLWMNLNINRSKFLHQQINRETKRKSKRFYWFDWINFPTFSCNNTPILMD